MNQIEQTDVSALEELSESVDSAPGIPRPAKIDVGKKAVKKRRIEGVLCYTAGTSVLCLSAVMIDPSRVVEGVALMALASSFGFAKFLVAKTEKKPKS